ncbi:ATP-binding protein [Nocardia sp. NPDC127526]|uniref:ATP-binding protein n=1 Tax=Nocardia sp. NPDC127526 TaxID=3345393 RepID=UPI00362EA505
MSGFEARDNAQQVNIAGDHTGDITLAGVCETSPPRPVVTAALRRDVVTFLGRDRELARILAVVGPGRMVSIHTIDGMAGVGKTALAVRAAHELRPRFPDGQYFVELHAHTPGQPPADPSDVLAGLLGGLGIDPRYLPDTLAGRRDMWRDRLSGRRVLLVLDDARDHAQIEPLLPGGRECLTLVTSRRRLIALDEALPLALEVLDPGPAIDLFTRLANRAPATNTDQVAVAELVRLCGYLPLAIVLLAGRLAHHATWSLTGLADQFAAATDRLTELQAGNRAVRAAFTVSYQSLTLRQQRVFRRLGLHPGPHIDAEAVAALADLPLLAAREELEALYTDHLIDEIVPGRYRLHDLLRVYTLTLTRDDPASENNQALGRLLDYYQSTALIADRWLACRTCPTVATPLPPSLTPEFGDEIQAMAWMRLERANLLACLEYIALHQPSRMVRLTELLAGLLERDGPWPLAEQLHQRAAEAAEQLGKQAAHASALDDLGTIKWRSGDFEQAANLHQRALAIFRETGNRLGQANALNNLGLLRRTTGDPVQAVDLHQRALAIFRETGNCLGQGKALNSLGNVHLLIGEYGRAAHLYKQALTIFQKIGNCFGRASTLNNLALLHQDAGEYGEAADLFKQALMIYQVTGNRLGEANSFNNLGLVCRDTGDYAQAADLSRQALTIFQETGNRHGQAGALNSLGNVSWYIGKNEQAIYLYEQALTIFRELGDCVGEADILTNLGLVHRDIGELRQAANLHQQALAIHRDVGCRLGEAHALTNLGDVCRATGEYPRGADLYEQALTIFQELGNRAGEAEVLNGTGGLLLATGAPERALVMFTDAFALARDINSPLEQAHALEGTARCQARLGDTAMPCLREAIEIYRRIGAPETDKAVAFLAELESCSSQDG